ncbi:ribokinase [Virgibacillus sp. 179-BFC.A HS]|uniref:Ribokinase n=1 Tax=Tigheibacillus jepli TaxID=3035914 RepID=A0ABU5CLM2_9BACI|nr:ribokinase [Virgibacillus sp. 179-BFC.A HS]MDY0406360.1 ribokinase [Virgibacillus sp. 179-BFC.A HS]
MDKNKQPRVCVVGSINMDLTVTTQVMPQQGETVLGDDFATYPGGKGANQAVAAARLGAEVHIIGALGEDVFGKTLYDHLKQESVLLDGIKKIADTPTGVASIILSENDNRIIVAPGANVQVTPELVEAKRDIIKSSNIVLLQLEIPIKSVVKTVEIANAYGVPVIVNPAPYQQLPVSVVNGATFLTPNEIEAAAMTKVAAMDLQQKLIVTKGSAGVAFYRNGKEELVPAFTVNAKDTTGAGDTFNGALAVALANGRELADAVLFANGAAALSVTKIGAQAGMPSMTEVEDFLKTQE